MTPAASAHIMMPIQKKAKPEPGLVSLPSPMSRPAQTMKAPSASQNSPPQSSELRITVS